MIASVRGTVIDVGADVAVIEVGGLGIAVQCTPQTSASLHRGDEATVHTSLVVREDSLTLYGFADADERGGVRDPAVGQRCRTTAGSGGARDASAGRSQANRRRRGRRGAHSGFRRRKEGRTTTCPRAQGQARRSVAAGLTERRGRGGDGP